MEIFTLALGLLGVLLSIYALRQSRQQTREIRRALSTQPVGEFPAFVRDITGLIERAQHSIEIACAVPDYAVVSNHEEWIRYDAALRSQVTAGIRVRLLCSDADHRERFRRRQFASIADKQRLGRSQPHLQRKLKRALERLEGFDESALEQRSGEDVIQALGELQKQVMQILGNAVDECATPMHLYCWIADDREAIFSIVSFADGKTEHGFLTKDQGLIRALKSIAHRYETGG